MKSKPLAEVLAHIHVEELMGAGTWGPMSDTAKAHHMSAMAEVVRALGLFGWEVYGKDNAVGARRIENAPQLSREQTDEMEKSLDPMLTQGEMAKSVPIKQPRPASNGTFVGDTCDNCGQPEIVRESSCRTRCRACGAIDGGCG